MGLKETITKQVAPIAASATLMIAPNVNANEKQTDLPATPTTQTVASASVSTQPRQGLKQTLNKKTSVVTESFATEQTASEQQMQRFEEAARQATQNNKKDFSLDNQSYDTKFVQEFIQTLKKSGTEALKNEFMLDVLMQSAQTGKTGKCFGKTFSNATECATVMQLIQAHRKLHGLYLSFSNRTDETFQDTIEKLAVSEFEVNGQKHNLSLDIPPDKQWKYFNNINEEFSSPLDSQTKDCLRKYAQEQINPYAQKQTINPAEFLHRLYKVMEASGNPAIRPLKESPRYEENSIRSEFDTDIIGSGSTLYLFTLNHIPDELAHAFRNKNNTFGEIIQFYRDGLKNILTFNSIGFTSEALDKNYSDKDKAEYDTHRIVEPTIEDYLAGKIPTIEQMYARIDEKRKKEGISYSQTDNAEEMTKKGYEQIKKRSSEKINVAQIHANKISKGK